MKQIVEETAIRYTDIMIKDNEGYQYDFVGADIKDAFIAGAEWQAKQSPWISVEERLPEEDGYYVVTDGNIVTITYYFKGLKKFAQYKAYPHPLYEEGVIKAYMSIPSFDQILEANKDVLQRLKEKGD